MLVFDRAYVEAHLTPEVCLTVMEDTLRRERSGGCTQYLRTAINMPNTNILGLMPAYFEKGYFGAKIISVYHTNAGTGYPSHQGQILLFGAGHGEVLCSVDAMSVTQIRTGAVSALASRVLARPGSEVLALLGCGAQGESHLKSIAQVFPLKQVTCWDVNADNAQRLSHLAHDLGLKAQVCATVEQAVANADIVCTLTPATQPILRHEWLKPGCHVNAVGACAPHAREIDSALAQNCRFFGDNIDSVLHESGDFLIPMQEGLYGQEHLAGTLGDVLLGTLPGRTGEAEITLFEALGMAVEDVACAIALYEEAQAR